MFEADTDLWTYPRRIPRTCVAHQRYEAVDIRCEPESVVVDEESPDMIVDFGWLHIAGRSKEAVGPCALNPGERGRSQERSEIIDR